MWAVTCVGQSMLEWKWHFLAPQGSFTLLGWLCNSRKVQPDSSKRKICLFLLCCLLHFTTQFTEKKSITQQVVLAQMKYKFFFYIGQISETHKILMMKALGIRYTPDHRFLLTVKHSQFNTLFFFCKRPIKNDMKGKEYMI